MAIADSPGNAPATGPAAGPHVRRARIGWRGRTGRAPHGQAENAPPRLPSVNGRVRYPEIDLIKAVSIAAVVLTHSITNRFFRYGNSAEQMLAAWSGFAVPSFLFASGFLFDKSRRGTVALAGKLSRRIAAPYLVCSLVAMAWILAEAAYSGVPSRLTPGRALLNLAIGNASGIYYFVFVIFYLYAFSLWLRKWPAPAVYLLFAVEAVAFVAFRLGWLGFLMPKGSSFWLILFRHPVVHLLPFLGGWIVSMHYDGLRRLIRRRSTRIMVLAVLADLAVLAVIDAASVANVARPRAVPLLIQVHACVTLLGLLALGVRLQSDSRMILFLSSASYAIYLVHLPLVSLMHSLCRPLAHTAFPVRILVTWLPALAATALLVLVTKRLLKRYSLLAIGY